MGRTTQWNARQLFPSAWSNHLKRRRYVIMANGRGMRWGNYLGIPKHLISVDDETLIQRIVRQVRERDPKADVVISSSDPLLETAGARRHAPERDEIELDRFAPELVNDAVTFLYGDTFYTAAAMDKIISSTGAPMQFYGDARSIVAVEVNDGLTMLAHLHNVRSLFLAGEISACVGWQVYQSYKIGRASCRERVEIWVGAGSVERRSEGT